MYNFLTLFPFTIFTFCIKIFLFSCFSDVEYTDRKKLILQLEEMLSNYLFVGVPSRNLHDQYGSVSILIVHSEPG